MSVLDRFRLDGKRLFITGGSRGLGREMALAIAEAGADVVLVGRELESLESTAAEIRQRGRQVGLIQADVGTPTEAERACRVALEQHGPIDIVINNVGGRRIDMPTQELPLDKWQQILDLNLTSTFLCTKILGGAMISRGQGGTDHQCGIDFGPGCQPGNWRAELRNQQSGRHSVHSDSGRGLGSAQNYRECHLPWGIHDGPECSLGGTESGNHQHVQKSGSDGRFWPTGRFGAPGGLLGERCQPVYDRS
jgi:NAD(P)-dependent dehydrogenase (short-subunit alcohol dehydrogenase family)